MSDSVDIADAAKRLQAALGTLEQSLSPILSKVGQLEQQAEEAKSFTQDRARLAAELDTAKSQSEDTATRLANAQAREAEFAQLAQTTTQEIDRVIEDVQRALNQK